LQQQTSSNSFELLEKVTQEPMFVLGDFNKAFQVECDASGATTVAVLSQEGKPVALFSEKLNDAKRKYSIYDQELYDTVQALKKWSYYWFPKEFVL
jgi:hypothetical protein